MGNAEYMGEINSKVSYQHQQVKCQFQFHIGYTKIVSEKCCENRKI